DLGRDRADPCVLLLAEGAGAVFADLAPRGEIVGSELTVFLAHRRGQVLGQQAKRTPDRDDVNSHEQLVQYENAGIQSRIRAGNHATPLSERPKAASA